MGSTPVLPRKKIAWKGTSWQTDRRTSRLLDRIGPVGRFDENQLSSFNITLVWGMPMKKMTWSPPLYTSQSHETPCPASHSHKFPTTCASIFSPPPLPRSDPGHVPQAPPSLKPPHTLQGRLLAPQEGLKGFEFMWPVYGQCLDLASILEDILEINCFARLYCKVQSMCRAKSYKTNRWDVLFK